MNPLPIFPHHQFKSISPPPKKNKQKGIHDYNSQEKSLIKENNKLTNEKSNTNSTVLYTVRYSFH